MRVLVRVVRDVTGCSPTPRIHRLRAVTGEIRTCPRRRRGSASGTNSCMRTRTCSGTCCAPPKMTARSRRSRALDSRIRTRRTSPPCNRRRSGRPSCRLGSRRKPGRGKRRPRPRCLPQSKRSERAQQRRIRRRGGPRYLTRRATRALASHPWIGQGRRRQGRQRRKRGTLAFAGCVGSWRGVEQGRLAGRSERLFFCHPTTMTQPSRGHK